MVILNRALQRFGGALVLGAGVSLAAVAFGSRPLGVVGVGLLLAAALTRAWVGLVRGPVSVEVVAEPSPATEGDDVTIEIRARRRGRIPVGSAVAHGSLGRLGSYSQALRGRGHVASGRLELWAVPRGVFPFSESRIALGDVLGLASVVVETDDPDALVVHPRLVALSSLFTDAGRHGAGGRRLLLRRPAGFDFHSVREYEQGESLRRVHWPTSARRGRLMVKELEDTARDDAVVVLDCWPGCAAGTPPDSSFDVLVRAAGSVLAAYVGRGRTASLVATSREHVVQQVRSFSSDFDAVLRALAAVEPDGLDPLARALRANQRALSSTGDLCVVTGALDPGAVDALLGAAGRRPVSVVWVDAPSFVARPTRASADVLRLVAAGIPVAVVRRGDDLAAALGAPQLEAAAHG